MFFGILSRYVSPQYKKQNRFNKKFSRTKEFHPTTAKDLVNVIFLLGLPEMRTQITEFWTIGVRKGRIPLLSNELSPLDLTCSPKSTFSVKQKIQLVNPQRLFLLNWYQFTVMRFSVTSGIITISIIYKNWKKIESRNLREFFYLGSKKLTVVTSFSFPNKGPKVMFKHILFFPQYICRRVSRKLHTNLCSS